MKTMRYDINKDNSVDDNQNNDEGNGHPVANACFQCFKLCCKKKASFGLEDMFWLLFLIMIIALSVIKSMTRIGWTQMIYMFMGSVLGLIGIYLIATVINKFCYDDASTAHWNAHARFTQAAIQSRLQAEEHRVHVIAPPRMGGAKLNIIYTVGDVPIVAPMRGISTHTLTQPNDNTSSVTTQQRITPSSSTTSSGGPSAVSVNKNSRTDGDLSPKYELPETPNNIDQSNILYEEHDKY